MKSIGINILLAVLFTAGYLVALELMGFWVLITNYVNWSFLFDYSRLISGAILLIFIVFFTLINKTNRREISLNAKWYWYAIAIVLGAAYIFIQVPLNWMYNSVSGESYNVTFNFNGWGYLTDLNMLPVITLYPIAEELYFRQFIQRRLQKKLSGTFSIITTAALFGILHLGIYSYILGYDDLHIRHTYITFFGGIIVGFIYYKSRSIGPAIIYHMAWNVMAVIC